MIEHIKLWLRLFRVWSLTATFSPIWLAACFNADRAANPQTRAVFIQNLLLAWAACGCLQIACNLLNLWGDYQSGVDRKDAHCGVPDLVEGRVSPNTVLCVAVGVVVAALVPAAVLLVRCFSWSLLAIAALGLFGTLNYCTGLRFKYRGWGPFCVFFLMGYLLLFAADCCLGGGLTLWMRCWPFWTFPILYGLPVSCLVANIMHANDMRDIEKDAAAGITTPATRLGRNGALALFFVLHLLPYLESVMMVWMGAYRLSFWCPLLLPFTALALWRAVRARNGVPARDWAPLLGETARIHLLQGLLQGLSMLFAIAMRPGGNFG